MFYSFVQVKGGFTLIIYIVRQLFDQFQNEASNKHHSYRCSSPFPLSHLLSHSRIVESRVSSEVRTHLRRSCLKSIFEILHTSVSIAKLFGFQITVDFAVLVTFEIHSHHDSPNPTCVLIVPSVIVLPNHQVRIHHIYVTDISVSMFSIFLHYYMKRTHTVLAPFEFHSYNNSPNTKA